MFNSSLNLSLSKFTLVDVFNAQCVVVSLAVTGGSSIGVCGGLCKPSWLLGSYIDLLMVDRVIVQIGCVCIQGEHTEDGEGTGGGHQDVGCRSCK